MSLTFTKLFSSITESTIWCEDSDTRVVWVTMMAMADKHGRVWGSIPGIANRAQVTRESAEKAIEKFLNPDPYSRSNTYDPESEGRRIEVIEGGWRLINHEHYRAIRDEEERRIYKAEHERKRRAVKRGQLRGQSGQKWNGVDSAGHNAEAEAEAEADTEKVNTSCALPFVSKVNAHQTGTVRFQILLNDKTVHVVFENEVAHYFELYPAVNVEQEFRNIIGWCDANPTKRKTRSGINRFINSWMSKSQNNPKPNGGANGSQESKHQRTIRAVREIGQQLADGRGESERDDG